LKYRRRLPSFDSIRWTPARKKFIIDALRMIQKMNYEDYKPNAKITNKCIECSNWLKKKWFF